MVHAIAAVALALLVGDAGRVVALDRGRLGSFWKIVEHSGLSCGVIPFQGDARELPFRFPALTLWIKLSHQALVNMYRS